MILYEVISFESYIETHTKIHPFFFVMNKKRSIKARFPIIWRADYIATSITVLRPLFYLYKNSRGVSITIPAH